MAGSGYSVVPVQKAFMALRIIQLILGLAVLGLSCYPVSLTSGYYYSYVFEPGAMGIFAGIATLIFAIYWFVAASNVKLYNYWAFFAVEFFVWVMWLTTFALYASFVSSSLSGMGDYGVSSSYSGSGSGDNTVCYAGYCVSYKRDLMKRYTGTDPVSGTIYTALALSVINFLIFSTTLILYTINMVRHRSNEANVDAVRNGQIDSGPHANELKA
ncbi:hypothetical protein K458DRAFT_39236 [Lentithecium fluviatile CBS 122367]|uniref:MARVEL domain-containing protein n=1 Tax=Lentithecium fluviatile CBS 122367 TaxID=1168545 RepID=A0A6G1J214_9PLEO|nr:hypothetical protein K458DRAFT_39236 [Lentithecium fluviatile CBS 122367]